MDIEQIKQLAVDVNNVAVTAFQSGQEHAELFNKKDVMLIRQALRIWRGDFPDMGCKPSMIWKKELTSLIDKCDNILKTKSPNVQQKPLES